MRPRKLFRDRTDAGKKLASHLGTYRRASPIVLGLPRGGVPVAFEIARALDAPLDVCVVRKLGAPLQPELGLGAVGEDGSIYVDRESLRRLGVTQDELAGSVAAKRASIDEQVKRYRGGSPPLDVRGKTVIVVDDGVATGGSARAALQSLRVRGAGSLVLAVPVGASETLDELAAIADEIVCLHPEDAFYAVSPWYESFTPTTDEDVIDLLARARSERARSRQEHQETRRQSERVRIAVQRDVRIPLGERWLEGRLAIPSDARALVLFAHGSGSSRHSPRNAYVATLLQQGGLATLLFDLLTEAESQFDAKTGQLRFDIPLLAGRLVAATDWAHQDPSTAAFDIGYFGASTGAAAALVAASQRPNLVHAVVSRGGRPDLAESALDEVQAPTLLLVGGLDADVMTLNRETLYFLGCEKLLEIVPDATHLFEEPGTLDHVARSATRWFVDHLARPARQATA
ncbi:MAG: Protein-L-isoaspartate O-methyltransferase [Labilithrix sp.]|nr:Protein-L-isoaspartate O-methyltransferase [Labilithrix sp.]